MQDSFTTLFEKHQKGVAESPVIPKRVFAMRNLPSAQITAPAAHALVFALASALMLISDKPILDGPGRVPFGLLWIADLPFSAVAFSVMFFSTEYGWLAWTLWGVIGTVWWYFLGLSIEAWKRRFSRKSGHEE
jgi:hypothetical protein